MREIIKADQPFVRSELPIDDAVALFADQPYKVEIIERVRAGAADGADAERARRRRHDQRLPQHRRVRRHVPRPARADHRPPRPLQADEGRRRLLAGQREGPDAAAHLRHRLGVQGRARGAPAPSGRGREARPPQAGGRARPAELPARARRRPGRVAPEGRDRPQADGGLQPGPPRATAATSSSTRPHLANGEPVRDLGPPRLGTRTACTRRWRWTTARTT